MFAGLALCDEEQLGYDPTIRRVCRRTAEDDPCFEIDVFEDCTKKTSYRTSEILADFGAEALRGRGTRVWSVYNIEDANETLHVLKDVWVSSDRSREGDILHKIKELLGADHSALKHFLTVLTHGDVYIKSTADDTFSHIRRGAELPIIQWLSATTKVLDPLKQSKSNLSASSSTGGVPTPSHPNIDIFSPHLELKRNHYRIVFEEIGELSSFVKR